MKNPARKKSVQSSAFRRLHAVVHVSAIMHILPGYRGTYIWGYVLSGHCSRQQISVNTEGVDLLIGVFGITSKHTILGIASLANQLSNFFHDCDASSDAVPR